MDERVRHLVFNSVVCMKCGRIIESSHVHDYNTCACENEAMVDGGLEYQRYGAVDMDLIIPVAIYDDEPFDTVRKYAFRRHLNGGIVRLCKMSDVWLTNAYRWEKDHGRDTWHTKLLAKEIDYRNEKNITVEEDPILAQEAKDIEEQLKKSRL